MASSRFFRFLLVIAILSLSLLPIRGEADSSDCEATGECPAHFDEEEYVDHDHYEEGNEEEYVEEGDIDDAYIEEESVDDGSATGAKIPKHANDKGKPLEVDANACQDRHAEHCPRYAKHGECDKNPGWMIVNCPISCNACHLLDPKVRCARENLDMINAPIFEPGTLDKVFLNIEANFSKEYKVNIISRDPWIVTFDDFMTDRQAEALIRTVSNSWERSTDTGSMNAFGETGRVVSQSRTSSNAWCRAECESDPDVQAITTKIEQITQVPRDNYESFQVLRYELGQKYNAHHDASANQARLACGPRILTFFLYLSDLEEGGETAFPSLGIAVKPQKGKALLWANTLNANPEAVDMRTTHEARPVISGIKYAANTWIHLYNFEVPNKWGCTGTFDYLS